MEIFRVSKGRCKSEKHHKVLYEESQALRETGGEEHPPTSRTSKIGLTIHSVTTPYERTSCRNKEITDAITYHFAKDMLSLYLVSKEGFHKMIHTLDKH